MLKYESWCVERMHMNYGFAHRVSMKPFRELKLDQKNPRLPEVQQKNAITQADLMKFFYMNYSLEELAQSYVANGFFPTEPLLILDDDTVIEGNRRLAALKYLFHDEDAQEAGLSEYQMSTEMLPAVRESLTQIPVITVEDRDKVVAYLGYKHINGAKQWSADAKARFVTSRVKEIATNDQENAFKLVAKEIGSTLPSVRNKYIHYSLLEYARDSLHLYKTATFVLINRFGVWERLANSSTVFTYIGFNPKSSSYSDINSAIQDVDRSHFSSLLADLSPSGEFDGNQPLLSDSRKATAYARILTKPQAIKQLRESGDFETALMIVEGSPINPLLRKALKLLNYVDDLIVDGPKVTEESLKLIQKLKLISLRMETAVTELKKDQGESIK